MSCNNYLINDFGILGSSENHTKQALEPVEAAREPIQDKNDVNINYTSYTYFSILTIQLIISFIVIIW